MAINEQAIGSEKAPFLKGREESVAPLNETSYREIPGRYTEDVDVLAQLRLNLSQLADLQGRMNFLLNEIKGIVRKS